MPTETGPPAIVANPDEDNRPTPTSALDRGIMALSRDMISVLGFDGVLREVNAAWEQSLG